jgi:hypothetical protein
MEKSRELHAKGVDFERAIHWSKFDGQKGLAKGDGLITILALNKL